MTEHQDLYGKLKAYAEDGRYPWHMPGHKRHASGFIDPFRFDITEIEGFDDLHHPEGILRDAMGLAGDLYGSGRSWFLVNGSTCGILAGLYAACRPGGRLLMARNCHKSAYHGALLLDAEVSYVYPDMMEPGFYGILKPETVEAAFRKDSRISAMIMVSPGYEGVVSDIRKIAEIVHANGAVLIVDEAHGAHLPFADSQYFPASALECGADLVIQSLHKTLPSLTQTAILHMSRECLEEGRISPGQVSFYLSVFQSSSPSYVLMASIDRCIRLMAGPQGQQLMETYARNLRDFRTRMKQSLKNIHLLDQSDLSLQGGGELRMDPSKIVLWIGENPEDGRQAGGPWLARRLRDRYHMEPEMVSENYVILMTSPADPKEAYDQLASALLQMDEELQTGKETDCPAAADRGGETTRPGTAGIRHAMHLLPAQAPQAVMSPGKVRDRAEGLKESSLYRNVRGAEGLVCCDYIYIYPPGIPLLVPGERIGQAELDVIDGWLEAGLSVHGLVYGHDCGHGADADAVQIRCLPDRVLYSHNDADF